MDALNSHLLARGERTSVPPLVVDQILARLPESGEPVRALLVGAHWTVVCSRHCGLASTILGEKPHGDERVRGVGHLHERSARELADLIRSDNPLEASIGLAAVNSLLDVDEGSMIEVNASEILVDRGAGRHVALVGHFPFIARLRDAAALLWVIEQHPTGDEFPAEAAGDLIPRADVIAITATALINHTLDSLLGLCRLDALVVVLGPSTPLTGVLFDCGVSILSGSLVVDEAAVLRTVGQGATFRQVEGVRRMTLTRDGMTYARQRTGS